MATGNIEPNSGRFERRGCFDPSKRSLTVIGGSNTIDPDPKLRPARCFFAP